MTSELTAESTEAVEQDVVSLLANIRRALSERANRPGQGQELPKDIRFILALVYMAVLRNEEQVRDWYRLPVAGAPPRWVREMVDK